MGLRNRPDLTFEEKNKVAQYLHLHSSNGTIKKGAQKEASLQFSISISSVKKIWKAAKAQIAKGEALHLRGSRKSSSHKDCFKPDIERIKALTVLERSTIRKMASKLDVSKSAVGRWITGKLLRAHTSVVKPVLTEQNKIARLRFSLSHLMSERLSENIPFNTMHNIVHIDEKWFFITKTSDRYYLLPGEDDPYRTLSSPIIRINGEVDFDGKIGIFPFTEQVPAKRRSKNIDKGTLETKPIQSINKEVIKACILNQVIPAIKAKWPRSASKEIVIQQDNAKPHLKCNDPDLVNAANSDGFRMTLMSQPANSPDTNVNDLGFFRAIQSLQDDKAARNVDDLMKNVMTSFDELSAATLNNVFLTLQGCYTEIMKVKGGNNYKIPHMNKKRMLREGTLPQSIQVEHGLVRDCLEHLQQYEMETGSSYELGPLKHAFGY